MQFGMKDRLVLTLLMAGALSSAVMAAPKDAVATVGSESITVSELQERIASFPAQYQDALKNKEAKIRLLDQMIDEKLLMTAAKKQGIPQSAEYKRQLNTAQTQLLLNIFIRDNVDKKITVGEDEPRKFFENNPAQFQELEQRRAQHILVKTESEAQDLISKIKQGLDFTVLAKEKSIDPSAATNGGDLGFFGKGQMVPEFEQTVFAMKKGDLSAPVKTQFGYHVIRLVDVTVRPKLEFEAVKGQIKDALVDEKRRALVSQLLDAQKKQVPVKKTVEKLN